MPKDYRYDVAISLLGQDQAFGEQLEQKIRAVVRGEVLMYSSRQRELAATGEIVATFTRIFRDEARVIVILYRPGWGETGYTSIEEDAIKSRRARTTSSRYLVLVSMEPPHTPEWYPGGSEFWLNPQTFSVDAIAAIIAERVHESGGVVGVETPLERARRLRAMQTKRDDSARRLNAEGPARLLEESNAVFALLKEKAEEIANELDVDIPFMQQDRTCSVTYRWPTLVCQWIRKYVNSMGDSGLAISIRNRNPLGSRYHSGEPLTVLEANFTLALDAGGAWGWAPDKRLPHLESTEFFTTPELVDWALNQLIERGHEDPPSQQAYRPFRY